MAVSKNSTKDEGYALLNQLWEWNEKLTSYVEWKNGENRVEELDNINVENLEKMRDLYRDAANRIAFLEMVTKGLSYMEQHDAQAYAKFVDKKRKLEDLDLNELRVLLR